MTVPIDGIILLQYTLMESRCAMLIVFAYCLLLIHNDRELTAVFAQIHCKRNI